MSEMRELYQEVIIDHHKRPRNFGKLEGANRHSEGYNPLCGDRVTVYLRVEGDRIQEVSFDGSGCAICVASSSVMTETLKGKTLADVEALFGKFHDLVTGPPDETAATEGLGKLAVFGGVREFPVRVKCAILPWHTLQAALRQSDEQVTTEQP
ncbi:MAG: SUF system NifU family Fe-S cluster assembly protein [Candidatus Krumholzibacteria bacterium]|nr:SUF system NifU family Fe-S cluster assembly protein [Candidatus Krumholzibacteria bacterium]